MAPQPEASEAFVDAFLETGRVTPEDLDALIRKRAPETTRLEYKGGDWLRKSKARGRRGHPERPAAKLCAWVSAFANTAGGVLVVGVDKDPSNVELPGAVTARTCADLGKDAASVQAAAEAKLRPVAARLPFPPRLAVVEHPDGLVLVVGVERSPELIPCDEESVGPPEYFVRTFSGTVALEEHVAADLLVGRRARPSLGLRVTLARYPWADHNQRIGAQLGLTIENRGLVWVERCQVGAALPATTTRPGEQLPHAVLTSVEAPGEASIYLRRAAGIVLPQDRQLAPFDQWDDTLVVYLDSSTCVGRLGVYAVVPGHPPVWWEVTLRLPARQDTPLDVVACTRRRPRVEWVSIG